MSLIFTLAADLRREMRRDYLSHLEAAVTAAETACNGYTVTRAGRYDGLRTADLFTGPETRAYKYATRELVDYWTTTPRPSLASFEAQWLRGKGDELAILGAWS